MPKQSTNDDLVRRHKELQKSLIRKCAVNSAEKILSALPKHARDIGIETVAAIIEAEFSKEKL